MAGCEAALQFADAGFDVKLFEMRPEKKTEAHHSDKAAELVCSNSFKSMLPSTASGMLKEEMRLLGSKILPIAEENAVPAGNALAVDREKFASQVTSVIENHPGIELIRREITEIPSEPTVIAAGPLASEKLTESLINIIGEKYLYFFDAIAPIVSAESIDYEICYSKSRYDKGESDYLNCPFAKEEYLEFTEALREGEKHEAKEFENRFFDRINFKFYENCTPIEELARRGKDTLRYGVMRPVGLEHPLTDKRFYGVIQLRTENADCTAYNLVGCQTMLTYGAQKEIFRKIPGLKNAEFLRYGSIHRNTYLNSPLILNNDFSLKNAEHVYLAGQISGLEGYLESVLGGLLTSLAIIKKIKILPKTTISGQLWRHLTTETDNFQPMNANFGLLPAFPQKIKDKKEKKLRYFKRGIEEMKIFIQSCF